VTPGTNGTASSSTTVTPGSQPPASSSTPGTTTAQPGSAATTASGTANPCPTTPPITNPQTPK
jgi:hypothetical protein